MLRPPGHPFLRAAAAALLAFSLPSVSPGQGFGPVAERAFRAEGAGAGDQAGWAVAAAGDLDGDTLPDLVFGAHLADPFGRVNAGGAWAVSGLDGTVLLAFDGAAAGDYFGRAVAGAGDLDGDGVPDLAVAAPYADTGGRADAGAVELRSGLDGHLLRRLDGEVAGDLFGWSLAACGDVDGDGTPDLLIGARAADPGGLVSAGSVYLVSGASGATIRRFDGASSGDWLGVAVAGAGDADGDGVPDLLAGAPNASPFGRLGAGLAILWSGASGAELLRIEGEANGDALGHALAGAGDVDGDGRADFLLGAPGADAGGRIEAGSAYLRAGNGGGLLRRFDGAVAGDELGTALAGAGDVDGDGVPDVLVGAPGYDHLGLTSSGAAFAASGASGDRIHVLAGAAAGERAGIAVAGPGDLDGDGLADLALGAWGASGVGGLTTGAAEAWLSLADHDGDRLADRHEAVLGSDPWDQDSDDDGLSDWSEASAFNAAATGTDPLSLDSDGDLVQDGTELGLRQGQPGAPGLGVAGTDPGVFQPDQDAASTTDPLDPDSDDGGIADGGEDANRDGRVNAGESDPNDPLDDRVPGNLVIGPSTISASAGGIVTLATDFHDGMAGHQFRMLGSFTGDSPGFMAGGVHVPLVYDLLTVRMIRQQYEPSMQNFSGPLDSHGDAWSLIVALPGELTPWIGRTFWWSAVSLEGTVPSNATVAATLVVVP